MNIRANIRNHISFTSSGQPVFNTVFPLNLYVQSRGGSVVVFLEDSEGNPLDDRVSGWVGDDDQKMQASIKEVAAAMIEKTRYYA